jgi:UDP-2,3-diacylglucosamine hydrolase
VIPADRPIALLGDAHLRENDAEVEAFVAFLARLPADIAVLAILGDLFSVWVGREELQRPHHIRVVEALRRLRARGCRLIYVEGNHDFFLRRLFAPDPFDLLAERGLDLPMGGRRAHLAHGDLVNRRDHQYRTWRALSKNQVLFGLFNLAVPRGRRLSIIDDLERGMARTNMEFRGGFPIAECLAQTRPMVRSGTELIVYGHFHDERRVTVAEGERAGEVYVLPAWRAGHRYLRVAPGEAPVFVSS